MDCSHRSQITVTVMLVSTRPKLHTDPDGNAVVCHSPPAHTQHPTNARCDTRGTNCSTASTPHCEQGQSPWRLFCRGPKRRSSEGNRLSMRVRDALRVRRRSEIGSLSQRQQRQQRRGWWRLSQGKSPRLNMNRTGAESEDSVSELIRIHILYLSSLYLL
jgi:hypothetical protein